MCSCGKWWPLKWIVAGLILIINQLYLKYDPWVVIGVLAIIKGVLVLAMPCKCDVKPELKKKR